MRTLRRILLLGNSMMPLPRLPRLLLPMLLLGGSTGWTAEPEGPTDSSDRSDYDVQGEYYGHLSGGVAVGVQVKGLGDRQFSGRVYIGGLPGNGWYGGSAPEVIEGRSIVGQTVLVLQNGRYRVAVRRGVMSLYDDRGQWLANLLRVHRESPTLGARPPENAVVLFDWRSPSPEHLESVRLTPDGFLERGAETRARYGDLFLHVEFRTPWMPAARGQQRGNSGIYLQRRYEVQVLDSFGDAPEFNGAASLYRTNAPRINAAFAPGTWQTYDIDFQAARFDGAGRKVAPAIVSVWHNGVLVQDHFALPNKTGAGRPEGPEPGPILFQDHHDPVVYRLIWIVPRP